MGVHIQSVFEMKPPPAQWKGGTASNPWHFVQDNTYFWVVMDAVAAFGAASLAILFESHARSVNIVEGFWNDGSIHGRSMGMLLALFFSFAISLLFTSLQLNRYPADGFVSNVRDQKLGLQASLRFGLLLAGMLYIVHSEDIPRRIVIATIGLMAIYLSLRRLVYRIPLNRRLEPGSGTHNAVIVGTGPNAHALKNQLEGIRHLGYTFKGFIDASANSLKGTNADEIVGTAQALPQIVRRQFIDEIFVTSPCPENIFNEILDQSRILGVGLRFVPTIPGGLEWSYPIEYIGKFPTIPLHRSKLPEGKEQVKRGFDIVASTFAVLLLLPLGIAISCAIKLDSPGPIFYISERIGKKGRVFRFIKFRTMACDAESRLVELMHMNERNGILFKIKNDPRITRLGRVLRKYSLDELPQFINVWWGDMSIVGPRPPLASEVKNYKLSHLRRLDVTPGITGLWQVQARKDPSFESYVSLDMTYIENWTIWLDLKIVLRTVGTVFSGNGS